MTHAKLTFKEAKQIPITDYLSGCGLNTVKIHGHDHWYHSPFRDERTPSFKVNTKLNLWYDHGSGEGGTIIDLVTKLSRCSLAESLAILSSGNHAFSFHQEKKQQSLVTDSDLKVNAVVAIASDDLINYLKSREISLAIANKYCKEIVFEIRKKAYHAIGFQNRSGGWELRNNWFKGSCSPKDISIISEGHGKLSVIEGFMDFLSLLQMQHPEIRSVAVNSDFLVLNSLSQINKSIPSLQAYKEINLFLDNDSPAEKAKQKLTELGITFIDRSHLYAQHKDLNDALVAALEKDMNVNQPPRRSRSRRL
ncbi:toprim domain-containing protein [Pseudochryseolinea flava]|uniref:Zinc finger CHC2-type domain-containing protein n=1 Tax=Pseudochryseolinea flava TaxID=2059302 RepID=A0A364Y5K7_9BACT|nr:toprim domain-containing protein [Pseudochryseolinea flava]RAW01097.1 hypothetical protein DQQ10_12780 [Pseudochryseolinea flava]